MTPGTFADPNTYLSPNSGVGTFIPNAAPQKDPFDSFLTTYDTVNTWRRQKEADNMVKQKYIKDNLADLDFDTKGVLPSAKMKEYLQQGKSHMMDELTAYGVDGQDPFSPASKEAYRIANGLKKAYEVDVNIGVEANDAVVALDKAVTAKPDDWDIQEYVDWRRNIMEAEVPDIPKLLAKMPSPRQKDLQAHISNLVKEMPLDKVTYERNGAIYDMEGVGVQESGGKITQNLDEVLKPLVRVGTPIGDAVYKEFDAMLQDEQSDSPSALASAGQIKAAKDYAAANPGMTTEQAFFIQNAKPQFKTAESYKAETAEEKNRQKAYWDAYGIGIKAQEEFKNEYELLAKVYSGTPEVFYYGTDGKLHTNSLNRQMGNFSYDAIDAQGLPIKKNAINSIEDIIHEGYDPQTGKAILKMKTTQSALEANGDATKEYFLVDDPSKLIQAAGLKYGEDLAAYYGGAINFMEGKGVYDKKGKVFKFQDFRPEKLYPKSAPAGGKPPFRQMLPLQSAELKTGADAPLKLAGEINPSDLVIDQKYDVNGTIYIWDGTELIEQ